MRELGMFFFFLAVAMVIFSSAVYYAEAGLENTQVSFSCIRVLKHAGVSEKAIKTFADGIIMFAASRPAQPTTETHNSVTQKPVPRV
jgi:hypothetical protein